MMTIWPWSPVLGFYEGIFQYIHRYFAPLVILKKLIQEFYTLKQKENTSQLSLITTGNDQFKVPTWNKRRNLNTLAYPFPLPICQTDQGMNSTILICGNSALGIFDCLCTNIHDSLGPEASVAERWLIYLCGKARGQHLLHKKTCL